MQTSSSAGQVSITAITVNTPITRSMPAASVRVPSIASPEPNSISSHRHGLCNRKSVCDRNSNAGGALVALLLLLCVAAVAGMGWFGWQQWQVMQQREQQTADSIQALTDQVAQLQQARQQQLEQMQAVEQQQTAQFLALEAVRGGGQQDWLINEAIALASLAQQRLLLTADIEAADRLLAAADEVLQRVAPEKVLPARRALAADRQVLAAAQQVDLSALVLKVAALDDTVNRLTQTRVALTLVAQTPDDMATIATNPAAAEPDASWWQRLLDGLPVKVSVSEQAQPLPLDEAQASLLRLTLNALLEQAQLALLQRRESVFNQSIEQVQSLVDSWYADTHPVAAELNAAMESLRQTPINQALPEIGAGLQALNAMQQEASQ